MKTIFLLFVLSTVTYATTSTPVIDTLGTATSGSIKYVATWYISASTTIDTLTCPAKARYIEVIHLGGTSGDTVEVSYAQTNTPSYSDRLISSTAGKDKSFRDFGAAWITTIYLKGRQTVNVIIRAYN